MVHLNLLLTWLLLALFFNCNAQNWVLVWQDEFNYNGLPDSLKWDFEDGCSIRNSELQFYAKQRLQNAQVDSGYLTIEAIKENSVTCNYSSASIFTKNNWRYGRFEIKAKLPSACGTWPAIWMLPQDTTYGNWPKSGEIDIMESMGADTGNVYYSIHTAKYNHLNSKAKSFKQNVDSLYSKFHLYALEWNANSLKFFTDSALQFSYVKESSDSTVWPFDKPFYLLLNLAIGGTGAGTKFIDSLAFPQKFIIDYVRVYEWQKSPGPYKISVDKTEGGKVIYDPIMTMYRAGTQTLVTALPNKKYRFDHWEGDISGKENPKQIIVNNSLAFKSVFVEREK